MSFVLVTIAYYNQDYPRLFWQRFRWHDPRRLRLRRVGYGVRWL